MSQKADILCVQETHFSEDKSPQCSHKLFPHCFHARADKKKRGVMIAIRSSIAFTLNHLDQDPSGRYLILSASFNNQHLIIVNIYAPNIRQRSFYKSIIQKIQHYPRDRIIICGDFNEVIDPQLDSSNIKRRKSTALSSLISLEDLYDPWRCQHGTERDYSFFSNTQNSYSRIDLFLTSKALLQKISRSRIGVITWSDHAPVSITLSIPPEHLDTLHGA